ncbi:MAG: MBL fold metallo-hydrolase [Syntrophales bacterium]|jgi:glyoxylase-like metal-dependent hydrolase (beta-lactamase superfamily II)|nr:MBL fold metallo-hydrolase [Syntrophales bacterium]MDD4339854.1 MBL fold metallo-hydrolase [Syntrophales bacterium]HOG08530.1 MBL fold metallo-hydrolase [Syntrophales bacterium]HOS77071.1 MBL fold metallo-hydrolase [Syntrophales bacterium]HPB69936.1 MBL fold metallo-hydrolase [Syntrophales bacterium]
MSEENYGPLTLIRGENRGRYPYCHSVFIPGAGILIDPSSDREQLIRLRDEGAVKTVWLSHWHEDHLMHLDLFDDLPLWMAEEDAPPLADVEVFLDWYQIDRPDERAYWRKILLKQFHFHPRRPARFMRDGEVIDLGGVTVEVLRTPGHSPGHLAFFFREPKILFLGDYDLTPIGPWYGDLHSSIEDTLASIRRLRAIPAERCLSCHETGVFDGPVEALWDGYEGTVFERERRYLELLEEPKTLAEIMGAWVFYGRPKEPRDFYEFGERVHAGKHLDWLKAKGLLVERDGKFMSPSSEL